MNPERINRRRLKSDMKDVVRTAQVSARVMTLLYLGLGLVLSLVSYAGQLQNGAVSLFLSILTNLLSLVLGAGFTMYCMAILRGERTEYLSLFDGFSIAGKFIALSIVQISFIVLWSMLFVVPGIIAAYRYRFAEYNLFENPDLGIFEVLDMSKRQTAGYKRQLFALDISFLGWAVLAVLPVIAETASATFTSKPVGAFSPVPTAVAPRDTSFSSSRASRIMVRHLSIIALQPEISWEKEMGTAS